MLDKVNDNSDIFIYGTGDAGISLLAWVEKTRPDVKVKGFIDSYRKGSLRGKTVYSFEKFIKKFTNNSYDQILIASGHSEEIAKKLSENGIRNYLVAKIPVYLLGEIFPETAADVLKKVIIKLSSKLSRKKKHYFFGEYNGGFAGNNKYFYLYLRENGYNPVWVTDSEKVERELTGEGVTTLLVANCSDALKLRDGKYFYFDTMNWQRKMPFLRHFNSRIIHMSHGVGLKMTLMMLLPEDFRNALTKTETRRIEEKIFHNSLLVSTSEFYAANVSVPAYNTPKEKVVLTGYPRNDVLYRKIDGEEIFTDVSLVKLALQKRAQGWKLAVYTPTFRDNRLNDSAVAPFDFQQFTSFLDKNRIMLIVKSHPHAENLSIASESVCAVYEKSKDVYPLLRYCDLLITDYSSVYMDFLHTGKPVLFYPYDYDEYIREHHDIQFDYNDMTPGPKAMNYEELEEWLDYFLIKKMDGF